MQTLRWQRLIVIGLALLGVAASGWTGTPDKLFGVPDGCNGDVNAMAIRADGIVYLGGSFTACEDVIASRVVAYDSRTRRFAALGSGTGNGVDGSVLALAVAGNELYVGGLLSNAGGRSANRIARWNGSAWSALGSGVNNGTNLPVNAIAVLGGEVYAGGNFTSAGGLPVNRIARWNGSTWSALGAGTNCCVNALVVDGSDLIVGGAFTEAGGVPAGRVARWNGSTWSPLGTGLNDEVRSLKRIGADLYAGGNFTQAGGVTAQRIARWNGSAWSALGDGTGLNQSVEAIEALGSELYVGGRFDRAGGLPANTIARWNGSQWSAVTNSQGLAMPIGGFVFSLVAVGAELYVGGSFSSAGGETTNRVARWNGADWAALGVGVGNGLNNDVYALAIFNGDLHVGGRFTEAAGEPARRIARWNGSRWFTLGPTTSNGLDTVAFALAPAANGLYVAGAFTAAGGVPMNRIARWDGSSFSPLGQGLEQSQIGARALLVQGSEVYAGGDFQRAGGQAANRIARWNGSAWSTLGSGIGAGEERGVFALGFAGGNLYAGGEFSVAGGQSANGVARWNGSSWSPLGVGLAASTAGEGAAFALATSGSDLYVAGRFIRAGGIDAYNIARWDGNVWNALGSGNGNGLDGIVYALVISGTDLYVGGAFTSAGGRPANGLARWDGKAWHGLAIDSPPQVVYALAADDGQLYAGGAGLTQTPLPDLQSLAANGSVGNAASRRPAVSRTATRIAFESDATTLVAGDGNGRSDVFVRDSLTGTTIRASAAAEAINAGAAEAFAEPALSANGDRLAFSGSSGQVYAVSNGLAQVLSRSASGALGDGPSGKAVLAGAGNLAFFESRATNLLGVADGNGATSDIYARDLASGSLALITLGPGGEPADGASSAPTASDDGQTIGYSTFATNLVPGTPAAAPGTKAGTVEQAMVIRQGGRTRFYVSRNMATGALGNGHSTKVKITRDGRYGVFESLASNLSEGDTNNVSDIYRFEISSDALVKVERVSVSRYGAESNGASRNPSISDDGQYVTFETDASNLIELDRNTSTDILLKWMATGEVLRLSRTIDGNQPNGSSVQPTISGDGATIVFGSGASNLTPNDGNNATDVFSVDVRERGPELASLPLDEPSLSAYALPTPNPANANCPSGFFSAIVDDGPGAGLTAGAFGMEVLLDAPGTRVLAGGLNFGGLIDTGQVGFAAFNIANAANEPQRLNLSLTGSPSSSSTASLPVRIRIARRTATTSDTVFESTQTISLATPFVTSIDLPPAFYEATVAPVSGAAGGTPEGQFYFSLTTSFIDRPGGGFQGGAVVGGYHATHPFGGVSGFAAFCLATPHTTSIRVLSQPSYGPSGAKDLRLRIQDAQQRDIVVVPGG